MQVNVNIALQVPRCIQGPLELITKSKESKINKTLPKSKKFFFLKSLHVHHTIPEKANSSYTRDLHKLRFLQTISMTCQYLIKLFS